MGTRGKFLALVFTAVVFVSLGVLLGSFRSDNASSPAIKFYGERSRKSGRSAASSVSLWGKIEALPAAPYELGTHRLLDAKGEVLALLESPKIDLDFLRGMEVEVEGRFLKTVEGNIKLVRVEKVRFR